MSRIYIFNKTSSNNINNKYVIFFIILLLLFISVVFITLSLIIIVEKSEFKKYDKYNCSYLYNTSINSINQGYYCTGISNIVYNSTYNISVLLLNPIYNKHIITVSYENCLNWINTYELHSLYECYINKDITNGYIYLHSISGYYIMLSIGIICLLINSLLFYYKQNITKSSYHTIL